MKKGQIYVALPEACQICGLPVSDRSRKRLRELGCEVAFSPRALRYDIRRIATAFGKEEAK